MNSMKFWYNHGSYMKNLVASFLYVIVTILITLFVINLLKSDGDGLFANAVAAKWTYLSWALFLFILPLVMFMFPDIKEHH